MVLVLGAQDWAAMVPAFLRIRFISRREEADAAHGYALAP